MKYSIIEKDKSNWKIVKQVDGYNYWRHWTGRYFIYFVERICSYCGKKCLQHNFKYKGIPYCNNSCKATGKTNKSRTGRHRTEEEKRKISLGHGGTGVPRELPYIYTIWTDKLKNKIRQRDNYICQICNMASEEHFIVYGRDLDIHHIDSNKKNCQENNLITLCRGCHARTKFNRTHWENYFREKKLIPRS